MPVRPRNCHTRRRNPRQGVTPSVGGNGVPPTLAGGSTPHTWTGSSRVTATGYASSSPLACAGGRRDAGPVRSGTLPAVSAKPNLRAERNLAWRQVYVDRPRPSSRPFFASTTTASWGEVMGNGTHLAARRKANASSARAAVMTPRTASAMTRPPSSRAILRQPPRTPSSRAPSHGLNPGQCAEDSQQFSACAPQAPKDGSSLLGDHPPSGAWGGQATTASVEKRRWGSR
jgi:hypothetical protein